MRIGTLKITYVISLIYYFLIFKTNQITALNTKPSSNMGLRSLEGKVVAMTGGGGGIGRATAFRCAELGATGIALCDTNMEAMSSVKKDLYVHLRLEQ